MSRTNLLIGLDLRVKRAPRYTLKCAKSTPQPVRQIAHHWAAAASSA